MLKTWIFLISQLVARLLSAATYREAVGSKIEDHHKQQHNFPSTLLHACTKRSRTSSWFMFARFQSNLRDTDLRPAVITGVFVARQRQRYFILW